MQDDDEQPQADTDEQQPPAPPESDAAAAADVDMQSDDGDDDTAAATADASNETSPSAQPPSQASRWRRAGATVALPPVSSYSHLTAIAQFPQLLSFLRTFRASLGLTAFSTLDLLTALSVPSSSPFHVDVVWGLLWSAASCPFSLRKSREMEDARMGGATVDSKRYPPWWLFFLRWWEDEWQQLFDRNPFERRGGGTEGSGIEADRGWEDIDAVERCVILEWLCEWKLSQEGEGGLRSEDGSRAAVDELDVDSLRVEPLGLDEHGDAYFYFGHDAFVFVEHRSEATDPPAHTTPKKAKQSRARGAAKQTEPSVDSSTTAPALLPQHASPHRWSVLCSTLQEMQQVLPALAETAPSVAEWLQENVAEKMASSLERRRGAEERRARMALVPRKRSSRIQMGELRREEEERKEEEKRKRQEEERQRREAAMIERQRERNRKRREAEAERMKEIETELMQEKMDTLANEREARQRERERLQLELRMRRAAQEKREAKRAAGTRAGQGDEENDEQDEDDEDDEYGESEDDSEYGNVVKLVSAARLRPDETMQLFSSDNVSAHLTGRHLRVAVKRKGIQWPPPKEEQKAEEQQEREDGQKADSKRASREERAQQSARKKKRKERMRKKERRKKSEDKDDSSASSSSSSSSRSSSDSDSDSADSHDSSDNERRRKKRRKKKRRNEDNSEAGGRDSKKKRRLKKMKAEEEGKNAKKKRQRLARKKAASASGGAAAVSTSTSSVSSPTALSDMQQNGSPHAAPPSMSPLQQQQQQQQQQWLLQLAHNAAMQRFQQQGSVASLSPQMQAAAAQQYAAFVYMKQLEEQSKQHQASRQQQAEAVSREQQQPLPPPQAAASEQPTSDVTTSSDTAALTLATSLPPLPQQSPDGVPSADQHPQASVHSPPILASSRPAARADDHTDAAHQTDVAVSVDIGQPSTQLVGFDASAVTPDVATPPAQSSTQLEQATGSPAEAEACRVRVEA